MEELAALLGRERLLLELLLFKLVSLRQLLMSGSIRFLPWAAEEVDRAVEKVREAELRRSMVLDGLNAQARALPVAGAEPVPVINLRTLADTSPEPWRTIFADHRSAFLGLAADLEEALAGARRLASSGGTAVAATLERLSGGPKKPAGIAAPRAAAATYGPGARWEPAAVDPRFTRTL